MLPMIWAMMLEWSLPLQDPTVLPWRVPCSRDPVEQIFVSFLKQECKPKCENGEKGPRELMEKLEQVHQFAHGISPKRDFPPY